MKGNIIVSNRAQYLLIPYINIAIGAVIIAAVPLLFEPTLTTNLLPAKFIDGEQNWILIAFLFLLFFQSTVKHSAHAAAYSSSRLSAEMS